MSESNSNVSLIEGPIKHWRKLLPNKQLYELSSSKNKQQMLNHMGHGKELDKRIRDVQSTQGVYPGFKYKQRVRFIDEPIEPDDQKISTSPRDRQKAAMTLTMEVKLAGPQGAVEFQPMAPHPTAKMHRNLTRPEECPTKPDISVGKNRPNRQKGKERKRQEKGQM